MSTVDENTRGFSEDRPLGQGLHLRCPHCRYPIEVVDEDSLAGVACPSCGSQISLISDDETVATPRERPRQISHFELLAHVGAGQFGSVWRARDKKLDRIVALKIPRRGQLSAQETEFFFRDARAAAQLKHPNIVGVHEVGRDSDVVFISSDFVEGANLREWLSARKLSTQEAAALLIPIAEAVEHAHSRGVIHRDLKPGNILIDLQGQPHVTDFGLAKRESGEISITLDGQILGTPAYMSPEQARGKAHEADARSDVYSLGVVLFELLTGELPFRGEKRMLIVQILQDEPPSPRRLNAAVPRDLETICLKCLEKEPARRFASAGELAKELGRFVRGEPIVSRPISGMERGARWCRRNPAIAGLCGAVAGCLLVGTVVSSYFAVQANNRAEEVAYERDRVADEARRAERESARAETQLARAESHLYAGQISGAMRERANLNMFRAWEQLESTRADLRGWEFDYVRAQFNDCQRTHEPSLGDYAKFATSGNGVWRVTYGNGGKLQAWDAKFEQAVIAIPFEEQALLLGHMSISDDGSLIALSYDDATLSLWSAATGKKLLNFAETGPGFSQFPISHVAFSPGGALLVGAGADSTVGVWETASGKKRFALRGHDDSVRQVAFSPDGKSILSASRDHTAKIWDVASGNLKHTLTGHADEVICIAYDQSGSQVVTGDLLGTIKVWDASTGELVRSIDSQAEGVESIAVSARGDRLATGNVDGILQIWRLSDGSAVNEYVGHRAPIRFVAFTDNENEVISASQDGFIKTWDISRTQGESKLTRVIEKEPVGAVDGLRVLSVDGMDAFVMRDAATGKPLARMPAIPDPGRPCAIWADGAYYAVVEKTQQISVRESKAGKEVCRLVAVGQVYDALTPSADGRHLFAGDSHGYISGWEIPSGRKLFTKQVYDRGVLSIACSPDGRQIATVGSQQRIVVSDARTGETLFELGSKDASLMCIAFSFDGTRLVSGGGDEAVRLWDVASRRELRAFVGQTGAVTAVAFSPDGSRVVSAATDQTMRLWDTETGAETFRFKVRNGFNSVRQIVFSPDGSRLFARKDQGELHVYEAIRDGVISR